MCLKDLADILSKFAVVCGVLVTWWYAGSWYKQYLYDRRDKVFANLELALKTAVFSTEDLVILMHKQVPVSEAIQFLSILMKAYKECRNEWLNLNFAESAALPFLRCESRAFLAETGQHFELLSPTFKSAITRTEYNGPYEAAEALKQFLIPALANDMLEILLMIQEESCRRPRLKSHAREIAQELRAIGRFHI